MFSRSSTPKGYKRSTPSLPPLPMPHHASPTPSHVSTAPLTPSPRRNAPTPPPRGVTPDQLQEIRYRHILELQAVKRETLELREEKAYLVAQNLRLQRQLEQEKAHGGGTPPLCGGSSRQREPSRPGMNRSYSHPDAAIPRGGLAALTAASSEHSLNRHASAAPLSSTSTVRPRTPSTASSRPRTPSTTSSSALSEYPFPITRRPSLASSISSGPEPGLLMRPPSRALLRQDASDPLKSGLKEPPPRSISAAPRPPSRTRTHSNNSSVDSLKGILKPPRSGRNEAALSGSLAVGGARAGGKAYVSEEKFEASMPAQSAAPPQTSTGFSFGGRFRRSSMDYSRRRSGW